MHVGCPHLVDSRTSGTRTADPCLPYYFLYRVSELQMMGYPLVFRIREKQRNRETGKQVFRRTNQS